MGLLISESSSNMERIDLPRSFSFQSAEHASVCFEFWGLDVTQSRANGRHGKQRDVPYLSGHLNLLS